MSDLISKSALIEWLLSKRYINVDENSTDMTEEFEKEHSWEISRNCFITKAIKYIKEQPTAYDVDKVIEKLTENLNRAETELANLKGVDQQILLAEREYLIGKKLAYAEAIDIIRADVEKMNKKRTNYEKIVSMGIDELADWMFDINIDNCEQILFCKNYKKCTEDDYSPDDSMCKKCLMNWLQQEAITK